MLCCYSRGTPGYLDAAMMVVAERELWGVGALPDVKGGQLWGTIKTLVGSVEVVPPPAPLSI